MWSDHTWHSWWCSRKPEMSLLSVTVKVTSHLLLMRVWGWEEHLSNRCELALPMLQLAKSHMSPFVRPVSELTDPGEEKGLYVQLCALTLLASTGLGVLSCNQDVLQQPKWRDLPGVTEEAHVHTYFSVRLWAKANDSFPQHKPGSHADVKMAKWKVSCIAPCTMTPFKCLMFYTLQFSTGMKALSQLVF